MDKRALANDKGKFLHICVEVNIENPLREEVRIREEGSDFFQVITYKNLSAYCADYGCLGHKK